jgi:hypothetical protein
MHGLFYFLILASFLVDLRVQWVPAGEGHGITEESFGIIY